MNNGILTSGYSPPPMPYGLLGRGDPVPMIDPYVFDPRSISGLGLWLDGSDTASMGSVSNNGPVKFWADKSGNARHATNSGADSVCPTLIANAVNGRSALGFDGGDFYEVNQGWTVRSQTTFVVALRQQDSNYARYFTQSDSGEDFQTTGHYIPLLQFGSTSQMCSWMNTSARATVNFPASTWSVLCSRHDGSRIGNSVNGGSESVATNLPLNKTFTRYAIGRNLTPNTGQPHVYLQGRVAEVIMFTRSLSDAEKRAIERYLGTKYRIAVA